MDESRALNAMVFVDPESAEGAWLQSALPQPIAIVPDARAHSCVEALRTFRERPLEAMDIGGLIRHCARAVRRRTAHAANRFADAAHLTRTFSQMFGVAPSVMMRAEFFVVPSPFTTSAEREA